MDARCAKIGTEVEATIMSMDNLSARRRGEAVDADAVCAACGTVNPEGTFICRVCGNNLRDQRQRRLAAEVQVAGQEVETGDRSHLVRAGLGIFGLLVVLWVALNVGRIESMLLDSQLGTGGAAVHWNGADALIYNRIVESMAANPPTDEQIASAIAQPIAGGTPDGRYVLVYTQGLAANNTAGLAAVETQGNSVYFAAQLKNGVEVRGHAEPSGAAFMVVSETGAAFDGDRFVGITGVAAPQLDGSYEVAGFADGSERQYTLMAYRLP